MKKVLFFLLLSQIAMQVSAQQQMQVKKNNYSSFSERKKVVTAELLRLTPQEYHNHPDFGYLPPSAPANCIELIHKRTIDSRFYIENNSGGDHYFIEKSNGPINFYDVNGLLRPIDVSLYATPVDGLFESTAQPSPTKLDIANQYASIKVKDFELQFNKNLSVHFNQGELFKARAPFYTNYTVGKDGAYIKNIFYGVDCEMAFSKGAVKTNFILPNKLTDNSNSEFLIISDFISLPSGYFIVEDKDKGHRLNDGAWQGDLLIKNEFGLTMFRFVRPVILDQNNTPEFPQEQIDAIGYEFEKAEGGYFIRLKIKSSWLSDVKRQYPVIIDPTLIGEATYIAGDIGFEFDNLCWNEADYCDYTLDIVVPGKTTLTAAYFDGTYYSQIFGCIGFDCLMKQAAFRILGPCDDSPGPASFWTCLPPEGDTAGTCYGIDLDMFNTIACIPPQCADYNFTFEMRTFHCSCTKPTCSITCHFMPAGSWVITIEGKTVEENPIESDTYPDFVICEGDTIDLFASGIWGVPPYVYEWLPGSTYTDTFYVWPTVTSTYTSVIHDICDMTDTVSQTVTVNPAPVIDVGPFDGCYQTTLTAPGGYATYVWTTETDSIIATGTNSIAVDSSGFYYVTVVDFNGCTGTSSPIEAIIHIAPEVNAFPDTVYVNDGALAQLNVETITGGDVNYSWFPEEDLSCPTCSTTLAYSVGEENVYYVTGEEFGCVSPSDSIVVVMSESEMIIPNAFTPNEDGLNDVFHILNPIFYPEFTFSIYNRWGQNVFSTDDVLQGWDGTFNNTSQEIGMYIWMVSYEKANQPGFLYTLRGTVTLLR